MLDMWRRHSQSRAEAHFDSLCSAASSQYSSTFELHFISPSWPVSSHYARACVCVRAPLPSCFAFPQQCFCFHVYTYSVWTLLTGGSEVSGRHFKEVWAQSSGCCPCVCGGWWVIRYGIRPRLFLSSGWFKVGTRAKEIHVILEREQEEEHRRAVISDVYPEP